MRFERWCQKTDSIQGSCTPSMWKKKPHSVSEVQSKDVCLHVISTCLPGITTKSNPNRCAPPVCTTFSFLRNDSQTAKYVHLKLVFWQLSSPHSHQNAERCWHSRQDPPRVPSHPCFSPPTPAEEQIPYGSLPDFFSLFCSSHVGSCKQNGPVSFLHQNVSDIYRWYWGAFTVHFIIKCQMKTTAFLLLICRNNFYTLDFSLVSEYMSVCVYIEYDFTIYMVLTEFLKSMHL